MEKESEDKPPSNLVFKINSYLEKLAGKSAAVRREFYPSDEENESLDFSCDDPLLEEENVLVEGLVQKYPRRVLLELTLACAAYCRFCTRRRKVNDIKNGKLSREQLDTVVEKIRQEKTINEVIFSGGDPLMAIDMLEYGLNKIIPIEQVKIIRVHTRVPVSNPKMVTTRLVKILSRIKKQAFYLSLHFEHPDEITSEVERAIRKLRQTEAILVSQSVFLAGVNDSTEILAKLFNRLAELGVRPYYIYRCDPVKGAEHFIVPFKKEIKIMTELRKVLSGIAYPMYVVDAPGGYGKVPVPLEFWNGEWKSFRDYRGGEIRIVGP
ncbi:MAG: KamA family radical SAM protein [Candidatus Shapirobacteria bacterium]|jgi:lysine 2,3-aminomutase